MGTCCLLTHKGFDRKQTIVFFYLIASRPDGVLCGLHKKGKYCPGWQSVGAHTKGGGKQLGGFSICKYRVAGEGGVRLGLCPI